MHIVLFRDPEHCRLLDDQSDAQLSLCARALETQLNDQLAPAFDLAPSRVDYFADPTDWQKDAPHAFPLVLLDDPDAPGAAGYHTQLGGRVFVRPTLDTGSQILSGPFPLSGVICHEGLEMRANKAINGWFDLDGNTEVAAEVADPVEHDPVMVGVDTPDETVQVPGSNFVLPAWFDATQKGTDGPFDFLKTLEAPFAMSQGGYMILRSKNDGTERQVFGAKYPEWKIRSKLHGRYARTETIRGTRTRDARSLAARVRLRHAYDLLEDNIARHKHLPKETIDALYADFNAAIEARLDKK